MFEQIKFVSSVKIKKNKKNQKNIKKYFLFKKRKKTVYQKLKLKMYMGPLQHGPITNDNMDLVSKQGASEAYLTRNFHQMSKRGGRFLVRVVLEPFPQGSTDDVIKYVKRPPKNKKMEGLWMCAQHQLLGVRAGGQLLVTL